MVNPVSSLNTLDKWLCYALNCDWFRQLVVTRWNEEREDLVKVADGESYTFGLTVGAGDEVAMTNVVVK